MKFKEVLVSCGHAIHLPYTTATPANDIPVVLNPHTDVKLNHLRPPSIRAQQRYPRTSAAMPPPSTSQTSATHGTKQSAAAKAQKTVTYTLQTYEPPPVAWVSRRRFDTATAQLDRHAV